MLRKGMFIKHDKFMDICIFLNKSPVRLTDGRLVVRGEFWNMGFTESWPLHFKFSRVLTREEIRKDYTITMLNPYSPDCLRDCPWVRI